MSGLVAFQTRDAWATFRETARRNNSEIKARTKRRESERNESECKSELGSSGFDFYFNPDLPP